jgi:hypothetical protein
MPQCAATAPPKTSRVLASYCMLVQPEESLDLFAVVRQEGWGDGLDGGHALRASPWMAGEVPGLLDAWTSSPPTPATRPVPRRSTAT